MAHVDPWLALGVSVSTAVTDAVYVMFNAAVSSRRRLPAATTVRIRGHKLHEELGLCRLCGRWIVDWSVCLADAITRGRKEQGGEALLGPFRFALRSDMAMERYELHGVKVYQLNICEAIGDHHLCPGITSLNAGDFELGTAACNCPCPQEA